MILLVMILLVMILLVMILLVMILLVMILLVMIHSNSGYVLTVQQAPVCTAAPFAGPGQYPRVRNVCQMLLSWERDCYICLRIS